MPRPCRYARLVGKPVYVTGETEAIEAVEKLGAEIESRLVVEDPDRPLSPSATVEGTVHILRDEPERVDVQTDAPNDSYLTLADTFDPGWSATLDGRAVPIRPAWITFRAVFVPRGRHTLAFRYRPAGFSLGLGLSVLGLTLALACASIDEPGYSWPPSTDRRAGTRAGRGSESLSGSRSSRARSWPSALPAFRSSSAGRIGFTASPGGPVSRRSTSNMVRLKE